MSNPVISIIVPVYKVEKYLAKCVESILAQTFADFELILVDDGSPDSCGKLCDEYALKDSRIKVIHKENGGLSDARNAGIQVAKGEYLGFVDSDDYIAPDMYELLYRLILENNAQIAVCDAAVVEEDAEASYTDSEKIYVLEHEDALREMISKRLFAVNAWNKLYKKELFSNTFYPKGMLYEDLATMYKLIDNTERIVYIPAKKYAYVQRQGSIMNQTGYKVREDKVVIVREMIEYFKAHACFSELFAGMIRYLLNDIYKMASSGNLMQNQGYIAALKSLFKQYRAEIKANRNLGFKEKMILKMAVKHTKFLQFLYSKIRIG